MSARARDNVLWLTAAIVASLTMAWLGLYGFAWNDYEMEAKPAVSALVHGHLARFFELSPIYGGSLLERAPFALLPGLWGGGELAVYRMLAVPCLVGAALFGLWLVRRIRAQGGNRLTQGVALGLCVANPLMLGAMELGHPEELLGGVLCVAAVIAAGARRPVWAGIALGVAFANKQWAILALGPVLLVLPQRRLLCVMAAGAVAGAILAPFALFGKMSFAAGVHGAVNPGSTIFQPWQVWWFFGHHGPLVHGLFGAPKPGYRVAAAWTTSVSHPLIVGLLLPLTLAVWLGLRKLEQRELLSESETWLRRRSAALLLLALLLLLRCMLDPWDNIYYPLPFVVALLAWETLALKRVPLLALASVAAVWAGCRWLPSFASPDAEAAFFSVWSILVAVGLTVCLYRQIRTMPSSYSPLRTASSPVALASGMVS